MKTTFSKLFLVLPVVFLLISVFFGWQLFKLSKQRQVVPVQSQPQSQSSGKVQPQSKMEAVSLLPDYQLAMAKKQEMDAFLAEIGFWQENGIVNLRNPSQKMTAQALKIELVPEVADPWWQQLTKDGQVVAAIDTQITNEGVAKISFSIWQKDFADQEKLIQRMDTLFRLGMYGLSPTLREETKKDEKMSGVIKHLGQEYGHYSNLLTIALN